MIKNDLLLKVPPYKERPTLVSLGNQFFHTRLNMYANFAWDFEVFINGSNKTGDGTKNHHYHSFGEDIISPVAGKIIDIIKDRPDNTPGKFPGPYSQLDKMDSKDLGNHILIKMNNGFSVSMLHFKKDTISVNKGQYIHVGQYLGKAGNTGASIRPNSHITTYYYSKVLGRNVSVPNAFKSLILVDEVENEKTIELYVPKTDDIITSND